MHSLLILYFTTALAAIVICSIAMRGNPGELLSSSFVSQFDKQIPVTAHPAPGLNVCTQKETPPHIWALW